MEVTNYKMKIEWAVGKVASFMIFSILGGLLISQKMLKCIQQGISLEKKPIEFIRASEIGMLTGRRSIQKLNIFRIVTLI